MKYFLKYEKFILYHAHLRSIINSLILEVNVKVLILPSSDITPSLSISQILKIIVKAFLHDSVKSFSYNSLQYMF